MTPRDQRNIDLALQLQLDLLRHSSRMELRVLALLEVMRSELLGKLAKARLTALGRVRITAMLAEATTAINARYAAIRAEIAPSMQAAAELSARQTAYVTNIPSPNALATLARNVLIEGAPSAAWWRRQSADTVFRFSNAIRQGIAQGETNEQIFKRVNQTVDLAGRNSRALVHTSIMQAGGDARKATILANRDIYTGYRQLSTLDGNTTDVCIARSNLTWTLDEKPIGHKLPFRVPPLHWGCRSVLLGVLRPFADAGLTEPTDMTRASSEGQIARDTTFDAFLKRRTIAQQNEQLGAGRAQMWRDGIITTRQLVDNNGNSMSLTELKAKYK
jgi:hypothetical protein